MKKIGVLIIASFILIGFIGNVLAITGSAINEDLEDDTATGNGDSKVCAQDAKQCSDGTYVSRNSANDCEFDSCPIAEDEKDDDEEEIENEETICCSISGVYPQAVPRYKRTEKSYCTNTNEKSEQRSGGAYLKIVDNTFCKEAESDGIIRERARLNESQVKKLIQNRNRLMAQVKNGTCPDKCTCTGSVTKCEFANGTREMTIQAGNSGNVIIQVQGINASTQVTLYKAEDGKIYAVDENNETKEIRMLPDQVKDKIKKEITARLEDESMILNEDGTYEYQAEKKARLFFIFPVRTEVRATVDAETGELIQISKPKWWEFLAREEKAETLVGSSCGTVTPGYNDECCKTKGYDIWNQEAGECEFLVE